MKTGIAIRLLRESRLLFILLACFFVQPLAALYSQTCVLPASGLVGWWRGEGDTENAITDETGTLVGNATTAVNFSGAEK